MTSDLCPLRLTSFVLKSFGGAKPYIFVDPAHIAQAKAWLASHQQTDGCIASVGKLFHNGMKVKRSQTSVGNKSIILLPPNVRR